jgi:hypothetical protein
MKLSTAKTTAKGRLPNLVIIGAQKCGTTSLHYYLGLHPQVSMSKEKELDFFVGKHSWDRGLEWYKSNFVGQAKIYGESSPSYTSYPLTISVPERMHSLIPEARLIYTLRDPIDRIISQYLHTYAIGREQRGLEEALSDLSNNRYVCKSKYCMQLEQYLHYFSKSNILIITAEDLYRHRRRTLQEIFKFLEVDETFYSSKFRNIKHQSNLKGRKNRIGLFLKWLSETNMAKIFSTDVRMTVGRFLYLPFSSQIEYPVLNQTLRAKLVQYLKDDIDRLRKLTGRDFKDWSV